MTEPLADALARGRALDPRGSFLVRAPAGSGKTGLLTQRFLALLGEVEQPEEVVAITFTRKAAGEMRQRILESLGAAGLPELPEDPFGRETRRLAERVTARDGERGWRLLEHPARLRVTTIDAFCLSLVRQMPLLSGMGAPPGVMEGAAVRELYGQASRLTLGEVEAGSDWSPAVARLLDHLDNHLGVAESLLVAMLERRDQWLRHLAHGERLDREELEGALHGAVTGELEALAAGVPPWLREELPPLLEGAAGHLRAWGSSSPITGWGEGWPEPVPGALGRWRAMAELLLTQGGEWRRAVDKRVGFPAPGDGRDGGEKALFKERKGAMQGVLERLAGPEGAEWLPRLAAVRGLPDPAYREGQWELLGALGELLRLAAAQLQLMFGETGMVDHAEVAGRALAALGAEGRPTDLALRLDYRIRHLLVDEFQDTSHNQFQLLERLTRGWSPGDGRTLFLVGDPMQSIYRFREAEVGLFLQAREGGIGDLPLEYLELSTNFRSDAGLVAWVNQVFRGILPPADDAGRGAAAFASAVAAKGAVEPRPVEGWLVPHGNPGMEGRAVAAAARAAPAGGGVGAAGAALAGEGEGTVAVLVRSRSHLREVVAALQGEDLPFQAVEIDPLGERPVVRDLLALTRALLHPADRIAWLAVLRAPWCGLTLGDLLVVARGAGRHSSLWGWLGDEERWRGLSPEGRSRLQRLMGVLGGGMLQRPPALREWVEGVWLRLGGAVGLSPRALEEAGVFLDLLEGGEGGGWPTAEALTEWVANLYAPPNPGASPRLQLMTMHKAKGLEFDTVILPGLGRSPRGDEKRLLLWQDRPGARGGSRLLLAPIQQAGAEPDPLYRYLQRLEREKGELEQGRLLYVAATRARRRLVLLAQEPAEERQPGRATLLSLLWPEAPSLFRPWEGGVGEERGVDQGLPAGNRLQRLPLEWRPPPLTPVFPGRGAPLPPAAAPVVYEWAGELARVVGIVVHRWLRVMAREGVGQWPPRRLHRMGPQLALQLARHGAAPDEVERGVVRVTAALERTLLDPRGCWLLDHTHDDSRVELPLTWYQGGGFHRAVVDRTFVDAREGVRWIVDYKTSDHGGGDLEGFLENEVVRYRPQLERYAAIFAHLESRPIRLGLYFPLLGGWREWEPGG